MDIKEIREWVRITEGEEQARNGGYYYSRYIKGRVEQIKFLLSEVERLEKENKKLQDSLYKNSRISDYTLLEERCAKLEKENAVLREVVEAAKKGIEAGTRLSHTTMITSDNGNYFKEFREARLVFEKALVKIKEE